MTVNDRSIDLAAKIERLERELATLKAELQSDADARLLHVLAAHVGDFCFSAKELVAHARLDAELRAALGPCVLSPRRVGKWLARLAARSISNGRTTDPSLRCVANDESGCVWRVTNSG